jgi:hypothetical protein
MWTDKKKKCQICTAGRENVRYGMTKKKKCPIWTDKKGKVSDMD